MAKWISFAVKPTSTHKRNTQKKRLTQDQVDLLEKSFISNKKLEPGLKLQLAEQLGITPRQVAIWYQNKRARWKNQNLEHDHDVLQMKLKMALTEKKRLENEVERLKQELEETQKMVIDSRGLHNQIGPPPSLTASCHSTSDDGGSSIFHGDIEVSFENGEVLRSDEELFVSLMAENGSIWN